MVSSVVRAEKKKARNKQLERECEVYTNFLVNDGPSRYILNKYLEAHRESNIFDGSELEAFETFLLEFSSRNTFFARLVDSYASFFYKGSIIRKKIILLLAILESCSPSYRQFEAPDSSNWIVLSFTLFLKGIIFAFNLFIAVVLFMPIRFMVSIRSKMTNKESKSWTES